MKSTYELKENFVIIVVVSSYRWSCSVLMRRCHWYWLCFSCFSFQHGRSLLSMAAKNGHVGLVDKLLEYGVEVDLLVHVRIISCNFTDSQFSIFIISSSSLTQSSDLRLLFKHGFSALLEASQEGHAAVVELLLEHDAQVDLQDKVSWTSQLCKLLDAIHPMHYSLSIIFNVDVSIWMLFDRMVIPRWWWPQAVNTSQLLRFCSSTVRSLICWTM